MFSDVQTHKHPSSGVLTTVKVEKGLAVWSQIYKANPASKILIFAILDPWDILWTICNTIWAYFEKNNSFPASKVDKIVTVNVKMFVYPKMHNLTDHEVNPDSKILIFAILDPWGVW